jgi:hypothetical protein
MRFAIERQSGGSLAEAINSERSAVLGIDIVR